MLEQFSDQIRGCYERAAEAKAKADATKDPALKAEFLDTETHWLTLARRYEFTESPEDFETVNSERRLRFDERLRANMGSAPQAFLPGSAEQILWSIVENSDDAIIRRTSTASYQVGTSPQSGSLAIPLKKSSASPLQFSFRWSGMMRNLRLLLASGAGSISTITKPFASARMVAWLIFR